MKTSFFRTLSFQVIAIIAVGFTLMTFIQYFWSQDLIEKKLLYETKKQALTYLIGIERQIQSLADPYETKELKVIFQQAAEHDLDDLSFSIINIYSYDQNGEVFAFIHEPDILSKDLSSYYGMVITENTPYLGEEIETHHADEAGRDIRSTDVIIPIHYAGEIIGGLEVEINLDKTFVLISKVNSLYQNKMTAMLFGAMIILIIFINLIIHWQILDPIKRIGVVAQNIANGDFSSQVIYNGRNEIGGLVQAINVMARSIKNLFKEQDDTYIATLNALSKALEAKDDYTAHHSENVTGHSLKLGKQLALSEEDMKILAEGAMLHDLGKIGIPDNVLNKPDGLDKDEYEQIKRHPEFTAEILKPLDKFKHFSTIARSHHERWDGNGYPDGVQGENIPLLARIVAIADSWDAIISDRIYRKGTPPEKAITIFENERDTGQWDPKLVDTFIHIMRRQYD